MTNFQTLLLEFNLADFVYEARTRLAALIVKAAWNIAPRTGASSVCYLPGWRISKGRR